MTFHEIPTLIATFIAISITLVGVIWTGILTRNSNQLTRDSNNLMEHDMDVRHRPWLSISNPEIYHLSNEINDITKDEYAKLSAEERGKFNVKTVTWNYTVKNIGKTPAIDICSSTQTVTKILSEEDVSKYPFTTESLNLVPDQEMVYHFQIDISDGKNTDEKDGKNTDEKDGKNTDEKDVQPQNFSYNLVFFEYRFKDHSNKLQKSGTGKIWRMDGITGWTEISSWLSD